MEIVKTTAIKQGHFTFQTAPANYYNKKGQLVTYKRYGRVDKKKQQCMNLLPS